MWTDQFGLVCLTIALVFSLFVGNAIADTTAGAMIEGTITDPTGAAIVDAAVTLSTGRHFSGDHTVRTDHQGHYRFNAVPLGKFTLGVEVPVFGTVSYTGEIESLAPVVHNVQFQGLSTAQQVTVTGVAMASESSTAYDLSDNDIDRMTSAPPERAMSAVVESVPGVVPEENGRLHVRGSEAQPQFVVDGVPIADNLTGTFATELDTENLLTLQIITGNIPAEFGEKLSGVVNVNTKSGLEVPWNGSYSFSAGSFGSGAMDAEFGGHVSNFGVFFTADGSRSQRFLDPPEIENFHNHGGLAHVLARFDWLATKQDSLRLTLSTNGSDFHIPNRAEQQVEGQDQRQRLRDDYEAIAWTHSFGPRAVADVHLYRRSSSEKLLDPFVTGSPFFLENARRQRGEGLRAIVSSDWKSHTFKFGVEGRRVPIFEQFALAVTDPADGDPESPVNAFTPAAPFNFRDSKTGVVASWFAQDHVRLGQHLTADLGVRFDHADLVVHDSAWSPRIGIAYRVLRTKTVLHASYDRLFQTPPLENILLSSSPAAALLSGDPDTLRTILPERQNQYEFGLQQQIGNHLQFGVAHYVKNIRNFSDDQQLFDTPIVFPVALAAADIRGTEVRLDLRPTKGFRGYLSYANARATVTSPLIGGLLVNTKENELLAPGIRFAGDQDERNEAQWGVSYAHRSGAWGVFSGRYDSGIPTNFDPADFSNFAPQIQNQLDPARLRLRPRSLLNVTAGMDLLRQSAHPVSLQLGVSNLLNKFYLYNFESAFLGTHIGRPREVTGRITVHWKSRD